MNGQGFNRTHTIPNQYDGNSVRYILESPTTVAYLTEIETMKIMIDVKYMTISGTCLLTQNINRYIFFRKGN